MGRTYWGKDRQPRVEKQREVRRDDPPLRRQV